MRRFLGLIAAAGITMALATGVQAQTRNFGARTFTMDDGAGHTYTMMTPAGMTGNVTYTFPAVPATAGPAGYVNVGTSAGQTLFWNGTNMAWEASSIITNNLNGNGAGVSITAPLTLSNLATAGIVHNAAGGLLSTGAVGLASSDVTGILPIANGGTGSATQNFVDLTTNQSAAGNKTFTGATILAATTVVGLANINTSGSAATLIGNSSTPVAINGSSIDIQDIALHYVHINTNNGTGTTSIGNAGASGSDNVDIESATGKSVSVNVQAGTAATNIGTGSNTGLITIGNAGNSLALIGGANWSATAAGVITATNFVGPLTGHASQDLALTGGTLTGPLTGTTYTGTSFTGNGATLTSLSGGNITAGSVPNAALTNSSLTVTAGSGLGGGGAVPLGGSVALTNTGVLTVARAADAIYAAFPATAGAVNLSPAFNTQANNVVFAGPASGGPLAPTFRALVSSDIPSLAASYIQNTNVAQAGANFNIGGAGTVGGLLTAGSIGVAGSANIAGAGTVNTIGGSAQTNSIGMNAGINFIGGTSGSGANTQNYIGNSSDATHSVYTGIANANTAGGSTSTTIGGGPGTSAVAIFSGNSWSIDYPGNMFIGTGGTERFANLNTAGIVHNAANGQLSTSTLSQADVNAAGTLLNNTSGTASNVTGIVALANGGTGVTNASGVAQNAVFAGPASGGTGAASFRALAASDIPSLSGTYLPLAGGTMSGALNMGTQAITNAGAIASTSLNTGAGTIQTTGSVKAGTLNGAAAAALTQAAANAAVAITTYAGNVKLFAGSTSVTLTGSATLIDANAVVMIVVKNTTPTNFTAYVSTTTAGSTTVNLSGIADANTTISYIIVNP